MTEDHARCVGGYDRQHRSAQLKKVRCTKSGSLKIALSSVSAVITIACLRAVRRSQALGSAMRGCHSRKH
jgi:hypothetical protein